MYEIGVVEVAQKVAQAVLRKALIIKSRCGTKILCALSFAMTCSTLDVVLYEEIAPSAFEDNQEPGADDSDAAGLRCIAGSRHL